MRAAVCGIAIVVLACCCAAAAPIHDAAAEGDLSTVTRLLDAGDDVNSRGDNGETALNLAILNGHTALAELLLSRGARPDSRNVGGFTALHAAAYAGDREIAAMLLARGADIDDQANKAGVSALSVASEENRLQVASLLIDRGASIELPEKNGYTPLTRAIWRGHGEMIQLLQSSGAQCQPIEILEEPAFSECVVGQK